eukprot:Amastigsp_a676669_8.p7 type:complete len:109 gc:universal Amastigsp_a676669_8:983-1309(+)
MSARSASRASSALRMLSSRACAASSSRTAAGFRLSFSCRTKARRSAESTTKRRCTTFSIPQRLAAAIAASSSRSPSRSRRSDSRLRSTSREPLPTSASATSLIHASPR